MKPFRIVVFLVVALALALAWRATSRRTAGVAPQAVATAPAAPAGASPATSPALPVATAPALFGARGPVTLDEVPMGRFREQLLKLKPAARTQALASLGRLRIPHNDVGSLATDVDGQLYYECAREPLSAEPQPAAMPVESAASVPVVAPPLRHSRPGAARVLYLDFNGHNVVDTAWNLANSGNGRPAVETYFCRPYDIDGDVTTFSDTEQAQIVEIWQRVAGDFGSFDVDVTTEEPAVFNSQVLRALITRTIDANGVANPSSASASGVAYIDVYGRSDLAAYLPAFVYYDVLSSPASVAKVVSHELGHNLALSHDGTSTNQYYSGHGTGDSSWGPLMGSPFSRTVTQWSKGEYYDANNPQDDLAILAARLMRRTDVAGTSLATAASVSTTGNDVAASDVLIAADESHYHRVVTAAGRISFQAAPATYGNSDLRLELLDSAGTSLALDDLTTTRLGAVSTASPVSAGTYYLKVSASGFGTPLANPPSGYTSYGSIGQYTLTGAVVAAAPVIVSSNAASIGVGNSFTYQTTVAGYASSFGATNLPPGVTLDSATGILSGRPTATGVYSITLTATNTVGTGSAILTLTVNAAAPAVTAASAASVVVAPGEPTTLSVTGFSVNGTISYQWFRNGRAISGATAATYDVSGAGERGLAAYWVTLTNTVGTTRSAPLFVNTVPSVTRVRAWGTDNSSGQATIPAGLGRVLAVAAGSNHSAALSADGSVVSWGSTKAVPAVSDAVAIAAGYDFTAALRRDGTVRVAGSGNASASVLSVPASARDVVAIAAGYYHVLALKSDGTVVTWGSASSSVLTLPAGLSNVVAIAAGASYSLALKADGTVVGWGTVTASPPAALAGVKAIATGNGASLALKTGGTTVAWGSGVTAAPSLLDDGSLLALGGVGAFAVRTDGRLTAWSTAGSGATPPSDLGPMWGISANSYHVVALCDAAAEAAPAIVAPPQSAARGAGAPHTLRVTATGPGVLAYQWRKGGTPIGGATSSALVFNALQLADAGTYDVVVSNHVGAVTSAAAILTVEAPPTVTAAPSRINEISVGAPLVLAANVTSANGPLTYQWFRNNRAIPGATSPTYSLASFTVADAGAYVLESIDTHGVVTRTLSFVRPALGPTQVEVWGSSAYGVKTVPSTLGDAVAVNTSGYLGVAVRASGALTLWGYNATTAARAYAATINDAVAAAPLSNGFVVLRSNGRVLTWRSTNGATVEPLVDVIAISASENFIAALLADGTVRTWGGSYAPAVPAELTGVTAISAGSLHLLALKLDGTVVALGNNSYGQSNVPVGLAGVAGVAAGTQHSLVLKADGTVVSWGNSAAATVPANLPAVSAISAGSEFSLVLRADGALSLWGTTLADYVNFPASLSDIVTVSSGPTSPALIRRAATDSAPAITQQPVAVATGAGEPVRFTVRATGTVPLAYAWRRNGVVVGNSPVLDLLNVQAADAGNYDVVVTNHLGMATSVAVPLSIVTPPAITVAPPQRVLAQPGEYVRLGVTATSANGPLSYQWKRNNRPLTGATTPNLTLRQATPADAGAYTVEITDARGAVSRATTFLVLDPGPTQVRTDSSYLADIPATLGDAIAVRASGNNAAYALRRDGTAVGWGTGFSGGSPLEAPPFIDLQPVDVFGLALKADGKVVSWGAQSYGNLGNVPAVLNGVIAVSLRSTSIAYALRSDGRVYSWDYSGAFSVVPTPTLPVTAIAAGNAHLLMLQIDGTVVATGDNYEGACNVPAGLTGVVAVAAGNGFSLALRADGTVVHWGYNGNNQYTPPAWLTNVAALDARDRRAYAVRADGSVVAWGGDGTSTLADLSPALSVAAPGYSSGAVVLRRAVGDAPPTITGQPAAPATLTAGDSLKLSVTATGPGRLGYQWRKDGSPIPGATAATFTLSSVGLADGGSYDVVVANHAGAATSTAVRFDVFAPPTVTGAPVRRYFATIGAAVSLSFSATTENGPLAYQWKKNNRPIVGATAASYGLSNVTRADAGAYTLEITDARGIVTRATAFVLVPGATAVRAWGANDVGQTDVPAGLDDAAAIAAGSAGNLVLRGNGVVVPWGKYSTYGNTLSVPTDLGEVVAVALGSDYAAVLRSDGSVRVWNYYYWTLPVPASVRGVISLSLGGSQASALRSDGSVVTWSLSSGAVIDTGSLGTSGAVAVACGSEHVLALRADGTVRAWSSSSYSSAVTAATVPANLSNVAAISAGGYQSVALKTDGSIVAWGENASGVSVGAGGASAIASGTTASAALLTNGKLIVWRTSGSTALTTVPADIGAVVGFAIGSSHGAALVDRASLSLPVITQQPTAVAVAPGDAATFRVTATGMSPLSYQWRKNGTPVAGATSATLILSNPQVSDAGTYDVIVSNPGGSINSQGAALTVVDGPQITTSPPPRLVVASGAPVTLNVAANSSFGPLTYRWKKNNRPIAGATGATFALPSFSDDQAGAYTVEVADNRGVVSRATSFVLAARANTQVLAFGEVPANLATPPDNAGNALLALASGSSHVVALRADGTVVAWGTNTSSQTSVPSGLANVVAVAANGLSSMALKSDGTVATWGRGYSPVETVSGVSGVIAIATADSFYLALRSNGTVVAWTQNSSNDVILTPTSLPAMPSGLNDVVSIGGFSGYFAAVKLDGSAAIWGSSSDSRVTGAASQSGLTKIVLNSTTALGLRTDGSIVGWGNGSYILPVPSPLAAARDVGVGYYHAVLLKPNGTVVGWGSSTYAQPTGQAAVTGAFAIALGDFRTFILREGPSDVAPTIVTPPANARVATGTDAVFTVVTSGSGPFRYQWRRNGAPIVGATAAMLTIPAVTVADNASYDVVVSNHVGSTTSAAATLTVATPPSFATAPTPRQVVTAGQPLTLTFTLNGSSDGIVSRWYFNGRLIAGANGMSYVIPAVTETTAGAYTLAVTDTNGFTIRRTTFVLLDRGATRVRAWGNADYGRLAVPASLGDALAISAGDTHGLALRRDGSVVAWGGTNNSAATVSTNLTEVVAIAAGTAHSLVLRSNGTVLSWGNGGTIPAGLSDVVAIEAGDARSIALKSDGTVVTWSYSNSATTPPAGVDNIVAVAAGGTQFLALRADGTVAAWANGSTSYNETTVPAGLSGVAAIDAGGSTSAALGADGKLTVWGSNASSLSIGGTEVAALSLGTNFGLLRLRSGNFLTWGGSSAVVRNIPADLGVVHAFSAGTDFALALCSATSDVAPVITTQPQGATAAPGSRVTFTAAAAGSGSLSYQWRRNGTAIVGATSPTLFVNPITTSSGGTYELVVTNHVGSVTSSPAILTIASAPVFTTRPAARLAPTLGQPVALTGAATTATGPVTYRWKKNNRPITGATSATLTLAAFSNADAGAYTLEAIDANGIVGRTTTFLLPDYGPTEVLDWGNLGSVGAPPAGLNDVVSVVAGYSYQAVLRRDGRVVVWGPQNASIKNVPASATEIVALAGGSDYLLALKADGTVIAWGSSSQGQTTVPSGLADVIAIAAGGENAAALKSDGTVAVWGSTSSETAKVPADATDICAIALGYHIVALRLDGTVMAWGYNSSGQTNVPVDLRDVAAIAAGSYHSLALRADGSLVNWGAVTSELKIPSTLGAVRAIAARGYSAAVIKADGTLAMWGSDSYGVNTVPIGVGDFFALAVGDYYHAVAARRAAADALPVITTQPQSVYGGRGGAQTFSVAAASARPLSYQWRRNGVAISGATAATLELTELTDNSAGSYDVLVSNPAGTVTSSVATLTIATPPVVVVPPAARTLVAPGASLTLSVSATSADGPLTYQWRRNNRILPGATSPTFSLSSFTVADAGAYTVEISDAHGVVTRVTSFVLPAPGRTQLRAWGESVGTVGTPAQVDDALAVSAGFYHSLALRADGTVLAWGRYTVDAYAVPADLRDVVAIAAGDGFSLALRQDGTIRGWLNSYTSSTPTVSVPSLTNVIAIAAGETAVALCSDGKVVSWNPRSASTVIAVPASAKGAISICTGEYQAMALRSDGTVVAWTTSSSTPATPPDGLGNVVQIAAGGSVFAAVKADGSMVTWGSYTTGAPTVARAVSCSDSFGIAQLLDGSLRSWGSSGSYGETTIPADLGTVLSFGAGRDHAIALREASADAAPTLTAEPQSATRAIGASHTFSVAATGAGPLAYQWFKDGVAIAGANSASFTLGALTSAHAGSYSAVVSNHVGSRRSVAATLAVLSPPAVTARPAPRTSATVGQPLRLSITATTANGSLRYQWKKNNRPLVGATNATLEFPSFTFTDAGAYTLEVTDDLGLVSRFTTFVTPANVTTQVRAWGNNGSGELNVPAALSDAIKVSAVSNISFALRTSGEVVAWGSTGGVNSVLSGLTDVVDIAGAIALRSDQRVVSLGSGYTVPVEAADVVAIAAGSSHYLALRGDGTVVAWGYNGYSQCVVPTGLSNVVAIAAAADSSAALLTDGSVVVWGNLGNLIAPASTRIVDLALGSRHVLGRRSDDTLVAWTNYSYATEATVPAGVTTAVRIGAAPELSLAIKPDGTLAAWGASSTLTTVPSGLDNVWSVAASSGHVLALRNGANDAAPAITTQPSAQNVGVGARVTFSVIASGAGPLAYQWRRNGTPISSATAATFVVAQAVAGDAGSYDVVITNHRGSVTSVAVALAVDLPPQITGGSSQRLTIAPGQPLALSVAATTGNGPLSYRWKKNNRVIAGATSASYSLASFTPADAGAYTVEVSDASGRTSRRTNFVLPAFGATQFVAFGETNSYALTTLPSTITGPLVGIAAGRSFNVVLRLDGTVAAWGYNGSGETNVPAGLSGVVAISAAGGQGLALKADGTVTAWGSSSWGVLTIPSDLTQVIAISVGSSHALALKSDGTVVAWGYTGYGATTVPPGLSEVVSIAAGDGYSLAVRSDGTVVGWGTGASNGQVSNAAAQTGMTKIAPNAYGVLGIKSDGSVAGWGSSSGPQSIPANLGGIVELSSVAYHALAVRADRTLVAWGSSSYGEVTVPTSRAGFFAVAAPTYRSLALRDASGDLAPTISQPPQSVAVTEGGSVTCSVVADGTAPLAYQWRKDGVALSGATSASLTLSAVTLAQAGAYDVVVTNHVGTATSAAATLTVKALPTVTTQSTRRNVAAPGGAVSFSVTASGTGALSYQWSHNGRPISGATSATLALGSVSSADAGWYICTITDANGSRRAPAHWLRVAPSRTQVVVWAGRTGYDSGQTKVPAGLNDVVALGAGTLASVALRRDGTLMTWGEAGYLPSSSSSIAGVVDVAATASTVLTLHGDGSVRSWGNYTSVPSGIADAVAISAGESTAAALRADGAVIYWTVYSSAGTTVADLNAVAIATSNSGSLVLKADGTVVSVGTMSSIPANLANVTAIAAGSGHCLALRGDGTVVAWGTNSAGQATVPAGLTNVVAISASANSSFAIKSDGTVVAWGSNTYGETTVPVGLSAVNSVANNSSGWHLLALRDVSADTAPTIATGPASLIPAVGDGAAFYVTAAGAGPFTYQWRKNGAPISGATAASLVFDAVKNSDAGAYDVVVSNHVGSIASAAATLTVENGPVFVQRPVERLTGTLGAAVTLSATVDSSYLPLTYQWQKDNRPIAGATTVSHSIPNFANADAGAYTLVATDAHGHRAYATTFVQPDYGPTQVRVWGNAGTLPGGTTDVVDGAAGAYNQAVVRANGSVVAWGNNISNPSGVSDAVRVAVGSSHLLAVRSNGLVVAAGNASWGQTAVPTALRDVIAVAAGDSHSMALRADGTVVAWGNNNAKQTAVPAGLNGVAAIAAFGATSIALKVDGTIVVWGDTAGGQANVPAGLGNVKNLALGGAHVLALRADGTVVAWGSNSSGQCTIPPGLDGVVEIAAGESTSFARKADGTIVVWGQNYYGQATVPTGLGTVYRLMAGANNVMVLRSTAGDTAPTITTQPANVAAVLGNSYSFSVTATGPAPLNYQWRKNGVLMSGQTSSTLWLYWVDSSAAASYDLVVSNHIGSVTSAAATLTFATTGGPTLNASGASRLQPALGQAVTLGFDASGTGPLSYQWKKNGRVIVGATTATLNLPAFANTDAGAYTLEVTDASNRTSRATIFVLPNYGTTQIRGWGQAASGQATPPNGLTEPLAVGAGDGHSLALLRDGRVVAWGSNTSGQTTVPNGLASVVAIAAGGFHNLALKSDGTVVAWGANGSSQVSTASSLKGVIAVAAGYTQSVALRDDGTVVSWGSNSYSPPSNPNGVAVAAGGAHALVLKADGTVAAWGDNTFGQTTVPAGLTGVVAIAAGTSHSAALKSDGTVVAWGRNQSGQTTVPAALSGVVALRATADYCLATKADGTVIAWGETSSGVGAAPADLGSVLDLAAGSRHALALVSASTGTGPFITAHPQGENAREGASVTLRVTASGTGALTYQWRRDGIPLTDDATRSGSNTDTLRLSGFQPNAAGNYTVVVSDAGGATTSLTAVLVYEKTPQSITFTALADRDYSVETLTLAATASSGLPVSFEIVSGPAQLSGNTLTFTAAGQITVRARQPGNDVYVGATPVDRTFTVGKAAAFVALGNLSATFDGSPKSATATTNPGGLGVTVTYNGWSPAPVGAGTYAVTATVADGRFAGTATGTLTIEKASQTITFAGPADQAFTPTPLTLSATATSGLEVAFSVTSGPAAVTGNSLQLLGSGTVTVRASQAGDENYLASLVDRTFVVRTTFDAWRLNYFSAAELLDATISGPNADPDADGFGNLMEYALGTHPRTNSAASAPVMAATANDWTFTYTRPADRSDLVYTVEYSANLTAWSSTGVTHTRISSSDGVEIWRATYPVNNTPSCFYRLCVSR